MKALNNYEIIVSGKAAFHEHILPCINDLGEDTFQSICYGLSNYFHYDVAQTDGSKVLRGGRLLTLWN